MSDTIEQLAQRLRNRPDTVMSVFELAEEMGLPPDNVPGTIERLRHRKDFHDLGNGRAMFSGNVDRVAFEVFRTEASQITFEEYQQFRDQPHILMRMSRDRDVASRMNPEKQLHDLIKEKNKTRRN